MQAPSVQGACIIPRIVRFGDTVKVQVPVIPSPSKPLSGLLGKKRPRDSGRCGRTFIFNRRGRLIVERGLNVVATTLAGRAPTPVAAPVLTASVSTLVPGGVTGLTLKLTFVVGGVSDAVNVTASVKPGDLSYSDVINGISGRAGGLGRGRRAQGEIGELRTVVETRIKS